MNDNADNDIWDLDCEDRYEIFLSMVAETRDIYILTNGDDEFLRISAENEQLDYLPVWPHPSFCEPHIQDSNEALSVTSISAIEFFSKWVKGLTSDGLQVGVFPKLGDDVWIVEAAELKKDLQDTFASTSI